MDNLLIDTVTNSIYTISNSISITQDRLPQINKQCEALTFTVPDSLVRNIRTFKIVLENQLNISKTSRENAYLFVVNRRPIIETISSLAPIRANTLINPLIIRGQFFSVIPKALVRFNNVPINIISSSNNEIRLAIPSTLVRAGNNRISIINPATQIIQFANNLLADSLSRTEFGNFGDSTTVFAEGIIPSNIQLIKPHKVIFSPSSSIYDTTFFMRGTNVYVESKIQYNDTIRQTAFTSQILNNSSKIHIAREGWDTLWVANPYFSSPSSRDTNYYVSNPVIFRAYDAALLPKADSASPRQIRPAAGSRVFTLHGVRFDAQTLIRCIFQPISGVLPAITDTAVISQETGYGQPSSTKIYLNVPTRFINREGILSLQALHPDTVGLKEYGRIYITNRYPIIEGVTVGYERKIITRPILGIGNPTISYSTPQISDSVFAGTGGENKRHRYFILKGRNFGATEQFISAFRTAIIPIITMNGTIIPWQQYEIMSDSAISFGYPSDLENDEFLTFNPGLYRFSITNSEGVQTETPFSKDILSPKPSINELRRLPQRTLITNNTNNSLNGITLGYQDTLKVRIYPGGTAAPNAKNFVRGAKVRINNRPSKFDLETTFLDNVSGADKYALDVSIPAIYLSAYNINSLVVVNPSTMPDLTDGGISSAYYFRTTISYPTPQINSLSPTKIPVGITDTLLTIRGQFFTPNTDVRVRRFDSLEFDPAIGTYSVFGEEILPVVQRIDSTGLIVRLTAQWRSRVAVDSIVVCSPSGDGLPPICDRVLISVLAPPPSVTNTTPATLETYINGEPTKNDTLTFNGTNFDADIRVLWNDTLALRIISVSATSLAVFVPDSLHRVRGNIPVTFVTTDSLSSRTLVRLAYPKAEVDSIRPDTIEISSSVTLITQKDNTSLNSGNGGQPDELPIVAGLPLEPTLFPNAPNPFDRQTSIEYALPHDASVSIEIVDALGRKVADLLERKFLTAGSYSVLWTPPNTFDSGVYTAVLQCLDAKGKLTRKTLRMTLIR